MGVFTFVCRSSDDEWTAKQLNGELEWSAGSNFELQRKLVQAALSADSSGAVQSSFSYVTPSSAVFQVIVGSAVGGGALIRGGGAAPAAKDKKEHAAEEKNEEKEAEQRRAYNFENMLSEMKMPLHGLLDSVLALEERALDVDQVKYLIKLCTTNEKMGLLKFNKGEEEKLGKREQVLLKLMQVPRVESMLSALLFKIQFCSQVSGLRNRLDVVNSAADQIRGSAKFREVMKIIFCMGNGLSEETRRCLTIRFRLESLLELTETRAGNYASLMHFLCKVLAVKQPENLDFWKDLPDMEPASKIQLRCLEEEIQTISKGLERIEEELSVSENDGSLSEHFCKSWNEFLCSAKDDIMMLDSLYSGVVRNVDAVIHYLGQNPSCFRFERVTSILFNFVRMFKQVHDEN